MRNYNVKFRKIKENIITIKASSKKEAIMNAKELLLVGPSKNIKIKSDTKYYIVAERQKKLEFVSRNRHI